MNPTAEELIALYADNGVEGVKTDRSFRQLCKDHLRDSGFDAVRNKVEARQALLERDLRGQTYKDQVELALRMLSRIREAEEQEICEQLVRRGYFSGWSQAQRDYFDDAAVKLTQWSDFFLSFTSHNPSVGLPSLVNNEHRMLIGHELGRMFRPPDTVERNLLALVLHTRLVQKGLRGFFYPEHEGDSRQVEEKLTKAAEGTFAFVQILQTVMFVRWPNFCKLEYDAVAADAKKTLVFVLAERRQAFITRERVDDRLHPWYDAVVDRGDPLELTATPIRTRTTNETIRTNLEEIDSRVVAQVESARSRLIADVPA